MALETARISELAHHLHKARIEAREVERLTVRFPDLDLADAYRIQEEGIRLRLAEGERIAGYKMGLTSKAKQEQMGLRTPIYGVLTDRMRAESNAEYSLRGTIHPKAEPEVAFRVGRRLRGRVSADEALDACESVCAALEILDSRFVGFKYFSLPDVVADNSSSSRYVLGKVARPPRELDLEKIQIVLEVDGEPLHVATGAALLGNPVNSLVELCALLDERGQDLEAGSIVLAGAATVAVELRPGQSVRAVVEGLESASVSVRA
jgi:2-oxo-3-hexenedioate decarboxylase